jgi:hypothetical protein
LLVLNWILIPAMVVMAAAAPAAKPNVTTASRSMQRTDWERFVQAKPLTLPGLASWLGHPVKVEPEAPAIHVVLRDLAPYQGGVDVWLDEKKHDHVQSAIFYLAIGPLYTDEHIAEGARTRTPFTLGLIEEWYGEPHKRTTFKRTGGERLIYNFAGDAKRTLTFTALPGSRCLHSIAADREE